MPINRRELLALGPLAFVGGALPIGRDEPRTTFRLVETAGLRRYGYPVHMALPATVRGDRYRLEDDRGKPVPAQFRTVAGPDGPRVHLDFAASPGPLEATSYTVRFGRDIEPGPGDEPGSVIPLDRSGDGRVRIGKAPKWVVREDLAGLLESVGDEPGGYLRPGSEGLVLEPSGGKGLPMVASRCEVVRAGPWAVAVRFLGKVDCGKDDPPVTWAATLTFPRTKSWVEVDCTIDDPKGVVAALALKLQLHLEGETVLADLGANATVYGTLKDGEAIDLLAAGRPGPWKVRKFDGRGRAQVVAESTPKATAPAEGWIHAMDKTRCTAAVLHDFAAGSVDTIALNASGQLTLRREFRKGDVPTRPGPRAATFCLHFVPMPVQVGAATSPQAILTPLEVQWPG